MSERYPERDTYGRGDGRSQRSARWRDDDEMGAMQYGGSRSRRREASGRDEFDEDDVQSTSYGRGYEAQRQRRMSQGQGGMRGQSYGGNYRDREDWDREFNLRSEQGGSAGWGGPSADVGDETSSDYGRYGRGERSPNWGGGYGQGFEAGGYYREPGRNFLTRGGGQQMGRYAGRGPKNYTRSDERIRDDINDRLTDDPELDATEIEVKVSGCDVTLTGAVESRLAKRRAEDCAESVSGVRNVQNNLRIQAQGEERSGRKSGGRGEAAMQ